MRAAIRVRSAWILALAALLNPAARGQDQKRIDQAVQAAVASLKQRQATDGSWPYPGGQHRTGVTALAGLALLECEIDATDQAIARAAAIVRAGTATEIQTYDIALAIMFFDRLGQAEDEARIQTLTARLLKWQNSFGGWWYTCPVEGTGTAAGRGSAAAIPSLAGRPPDDDNSNTQFATLALWVARRHKLAADTALEAVGQRFHGSQNADGGWSYHLYPGAYPQPGAYTQQSSASMTCAGLLGVAVSYGVAREAVLRTRLDGQEEEKSRASLPRDPNRDPAVRLGLLALSELLRGPTGLVPTGGGAGLRQGRPAFGPGGPGGPLPRAAGGPGRLNYYLLWSLERVAMAFGLRTIGKLDWYAWASPLVLAAQQADGSWEGNAGPVVDTSFALLFLRRSNLVKDLSNDLRDLVHDPSEVRLKSGGVGGRGLRGRESSLDPGAAGKPDARRKKSRPSSIPDLRPDDEGDSAGGSRSRARSGEEPGDGEAAQLSAAVVAAAGAEQEALIDRLRDARGVVNTQALATAIPQLGGAARTRARDALAERLTRMTTATLRDKFRDEDLEIRRAAALAGAMKNEPVFIPDLIALLTDPEPPVTRAAHAALKALTREDFGPGVDASRAERAQAVDKWKAWWASRKDK